MVLPFFSFLFFFFFLAWFIQPTGVTIFFPFFPFFFFGGIWIGARVLYFLLAHELSGVDLSTFRSSTFFDQHDRLSYWSFFFSFSFDSLPFGGGGSLIVNIVYLVLS